MSYHNQEISLHAGQPVELYRFALGATVWRYTSTRDAVTYNAEKYTPAPIRRSEIEQTQEFGRAMLNLETMNPRSHCLRWWWGRGIFAFSLK